MGVDAHLYINSDFRVETIMEIMEKAMGCENVTAHPATNPDYVTICFDYEGEGRSMWTGHHAETPLGSAIYLKLGSNAHSNRFFRELAQYTGGFYEEDDCKGGFEMLEATLHFKN